MSSARLPLEDLGAAVYGPKNCWMFFETGRRELLILFGFGCVTSLLSGDHHISLHFVFLDSAKVSMGTITATSSIAYPNCRTVFKNPVLPNSC